MREELNEIKMTLIPESEPTREELQEIEIGKREITDEKCKSWKKIKEEFYL